MAAGWGVETALATRHCKYCGRKIYKGEQCLGTFSYHASSTYCEECVAKELWMKHFVLR